jgi:hypothetical protein
LSLDEKSNLDGLNDLAQAVQSMRGIACAASYLPQAYHLHVAADQWCQQNSGIDSHSDVVLFEFLRDSMFDHLLVRLRRMCMDSNPTSLGGDKLRQLLSDKPLVSQLAARRKDPRHGACAMTDDDVALHFSFIQRRCAQLSTGGRPKDYWRTLDKFSLEAHAFLVKRAADWRSAHMTFAQWKIGRSDLTSVVFNVMVLARAIQRVTGDDSYDGDYELLDRLGFDNARKVVGISHAAGLLIESLDDNVAMQLRTCKFLTPQSDNFASDPS